METRDNKPYESARERQQQGREQVRAGESGESASAHDAEGHVRREWEGESRRRATRVHPPTHTHGRGKVEKKQTQRGGKMGLVCSSTHRRCGCPSGRGEREGRGGVTGKEAETRASEGRRKKESGLLDGEGARGTQRCETQEGQADGGSESGARPGWSALGRTTDDVEG